MRIIVRDLPVKITKEEIEKEFSRHGKITDVFMVKNDVGEFKRVCFIGYLEEDAGARAIKYHNGALFRNHRIRCDVTREPDVKRTNESVERMIKYSKQLFVGNIPDGVDESHLRETFEKYGKVSSVEMMRQKGGSGARVEFSVGECAVNGYREVKMIGGARVNISAWRDTTSKDCYEHYNSLFFNFESIIKRTCESENIDVKDLVNIRDKNLGVRISQIETHLVQQTKEFLENNGIFLDRLSGDVDRKVLILRNMELMRCLDLVKGDCRIDVAPSKCLALLRFKNEREAAECYKGLNLRRMREHVIYCEYAPLCDGTSQDRDEVKQHNVEIRNKQMNNKLLVRNVPFQASEDEIRKIFDPYVRVVSVRIPIKREGTSRGFCFVTLDSADDVTTAIEYFGNSTHLYGRRLVLERAKS